MSFYIVHQIEGKQTPHFSKIIFHIDRKQLSYEQESILHSLNELDFCILETDNDKFIKIYFNVPEQLLTEEFSKLLFKILKFVLNGSEPNVTTIISEKEYKQIIYFPNTEHNPNGFFMPIDYVANKNKCVGELFTKLFLYIQSSEGFILGQIFDYFFHAEKSPLEVEGLLYCIAVEDILKKIEPSLNMKETEKYKNILENLVILENQILLMELDNDFKNRAKGAVNLIKNLAPKNILIHLQNLYPINEQDTKAFGSIRNKLAHKMENYSGDIQPDYDKIIRLKILIHKLIFILINYDGNYTDYNQRDFPIEIFKK